jgi:hypothetical protein
MYKFFIGNTGSAGSSYDAMKPNAQVSDTTGDAISTTARTQKLNFSNLVA